MNRILKRLADDQQLMDLQQKGQQVQQALANIKTQLEQTIPMIQDPLIQSNGSLIGLNSEELTNSINTFIAQIDTILTT